MLSHHKLRIDLRAQITPHLLLYGRSDSVEPFLKFFVHCFLRVIICYLHNRSGSIKHFRKLLELDELLEPSVEAIDLVEFSVSLMIYVAKILACIGGDLRQAFVEDIFLIHLFEISNVFLTHFNQVLTW